MYGKNSTFNLSGGSITGNSSVDGGAIYLNREPSVLNMTGGVISGNTASGNGGGVYIFRSGSVCNLSGGTIEKNTAKVGGGIYINPSNNGQLKLSGAPTVKNNTVSGAANNVYLPSGKTLSISGAMTSGASVGITTQSKNYPVAFSGIYDTNYEDFFSSDDEAAEVVYKTDKKLYLDTRQYGITISSTDGGTASADCLRAATGTQITLTATPNDGFHFKEWKVLNGDITITENSFAMPASDVTIQAVFEEHSFTAETAEEMYLKSAADCENAAVYYKSCTVCGLSSAGTADEATFFSGEPLDHDWGEPNYTWTEVPDGYMCAAKKVCQRCHTDVGEVAAVTYAVTDKPTCLNNGTGTYTATFSAFDFPTQTKTVDLPATGHSWGDTEYTWTST